MPKKKGELSIEKRLEQSIVAKEEEPYKLPSNWVWTRLIDNFAECLDTFRKPINAEERAKRKGNIPYYGATGQVGFIDDYLLDGEFILLGEDGAPFLDLFKKKAYKITGKSWVNNHAHVLKSFFGKTGNDYMLHYLNNFNYKDYVNGTTRLKLTQEKLKKIPIPVPPLEEQKRIVEKLDSLFEKIQKIKEIIEEVKEKTTSRREAILSKAFSGELTEKWRGENHTENARELLVKINDEKLKLWEDECKKAEDEGRKKPAKPKLKTIDEMLVGAEEMPYKLPNNWVWTRLGDIIEYTENLDIQKKMTSDTLINYVDIEGIDNVNYKIKNVKLKKVSELSSRARRVLKKGYILYSSVRPYLNNLALIEDQKENYIGSTGFFVFKSIIGENKYIFNFLLSFYVRKYYLDSLKGFNSPSISNTIFENTFIPLPPLEEQKEIVRVLDKVFEEENRISELISLENKIEILEKTILDRAFRGELGTGNNDDEPAIELLKKCLEER